VALFEPLGLPTGGLWSVNVNGTVRTSYGGNISFLLTNGSYPFETHGPAGFVPSPPSGLLVIAGGNVTVSIQFLQVLYPVSFVPVGLPNGTSWGVVLQGVLRTDPSGGPIDFREPNGSYSFQVAPVGGFSPSPSQGSVLVRGNNVTDFIQFAPVTFPVSFYSLGLPRDTYWGVELNGLWTFATTPGLLARLANGTYSYAFSLVAGYHPSRPGGTFVVDGGPLSFTLLWNATTYPVEFSVSGLPSSQDWTLIFNGVTYVLDGLTFNLTEPNGTYPFSLNTSGPYQGNPSSGWVQVSGGPAELRFTFSRPLTPLQVVVAYLPEIGIGVVVLLALVVALALYLRRRRGRDGGPPGSALRPSSGPPAALPSRETPTLPPSLPAPSPASARLGALQQQLRELRQRAEQSDLDPERVAELLPRLETVAQHVRASEWELAEDELAQLQVLVGAVPSPLPVAASEGPKAAG
jgi:hypothetical protein